MKNFLLGTVSYDGSFSISLVIRRKCDIFFSYYNDKKEIKGRRTYIFLNDICNNNEPRSHTVLYGKDTSFDNNKCDRKNTDVQISIPGMRKPSTLSTGAKVMR